MEGENVRKGNRSHENRTVSFGEWLVRVKFSILGMFILQSPKRSWFDDGTAEKINKKRIPMITKIMNDSFRRTVTEKVKEINQFSENLIIH